jgi:hypothetical protein
MTSACPNCKKAVEHEDFMFEVVCFCGARFNPFVQLDELVKVEGMELSSPTPDHAESQSAFAEIRQFAEELSAPKKQNPSKTPRPAEKADDQAATVVSYSADHPNILITSADALQEKTIETYLSSVSAISGVSNEENPLHAIFEKLSQQASSLGANAILSLRWSFSPDGTKILASGNAVRLVK